MKIVIDAYQHTAQITGTDRMAYFLLKELQGIDSVNEYHIICSSHRYVASAVTKDNFKVVKPLVLALPPTLAKIYSRLWKTFILIRYSFNGVDVYYSFHNMLVPRINVAKKIVASNLDLIPYVRNEYKPSGRRLRSIAYAARKADKFISISGFSKNELIQHFGIKDKSVYVMPLAAEGSSKSINKKLYDNSGYILTIGGSEPRKNVKTVIDAYSELPDDLKDRFSLFIAGGEWRGRQLDVPNDQKGVKILGYVEEDKLKRLFSGASVFVFASDYEGFGLTILEAMSVGTPVISSSGTSLPEVYAHAALEFESNNKDALRRHLLDVLRSKDLRLKLSKSGLDRSKEFSWNRSAIILHQALTSEK